MDLGMTSNLRGLRPPSRVQKLRAYGLTTAWALSWICMTIATLGGTVGGWDDRAQRALYAWGQWLALAAVILSGWAIVSHYSRRERMRLEDLARIMASERERGESRRRPVLTLHHQTGGGRARGDLAVTSRGTPTGV